MPLTLGEAHRVHGDAREGDAAHRTERGGGRHVHTLLQAGARYPPTTLASLRTATDNVH